MSSILKQDTLLSLVQTLRENVSLNKISCFVVQSSALGLKKEKKKIVFFSSLRAPDPFSSLEILDFLSTCLGIDALSSLCYRSGSCCLSIYMQQYVSVNPEVLMYPFPPTICFGTYKFVSYVYESVAVL